MANEQSKPAENGNNQVYEGRIFRVVGKNIYVTFDKPIIIQHPKGNHPVNKIILNYDVLKKIHPDWAELHPYDEKTLKGDSVPVSHRTLLAIVDKHYETELQKEKLTPRELSAKRKSASRNENPIDADLEKILGNVEQDKD